jgi:hypothetical protein
VNEGRKLPNFSNVGAALARRGHIEVEVEVEVPMLV